MSTLWLTFIGLLSAGCALIALGGWRTSGGRAAAQRDTLNIQFYQQRLNELQQDDDQGLIDEKQAIITELQHTLLTDLPEKAPPVQPRNSHCRVLLPPMLILIVVTSGLYLKTGNLPEVIRFSQLRASYPDLRDRLMDPQGKPLNIGELRRLSLGLRDHLQQDPENVRDLVILGRLAMLLNHFQQARQAFERALTLEPGNQHLQSDYAEVLVRSADRQEHRQGELLLQDMLKRHPGDIRIITLLAADYYTQQKYHQAIEYWQQALGRLSADTPQGEVIRLGIEQAKSRAGQQIRPLKLTIDLSLAAKKMLTPNGILYISVTDGISPVPVAVKRVTFSHFPLQLTLDDSDAMVPERLLSAQHQLRIRAHISRDGSDKPRSGDWYAQAGVTDFTGQQSVAVMLDQQLP